MTRRDALIAETRFDEVRLFPGPGRALIMSAYMIIISNSAKT